MSGTGDISTEKTVWCIACSKWEQFAEFQWKPGGIVKCAREYGWRKVGGFWTCPRCVKRQQQGD